VNFLLVLKLKLFIGAGRARTDDDGIMSLSRYGSMRDPVYLESSK